MKRNNLPHGEQLIDLCNNAVQKLFRAHSTKYLTGATGIISNPNLQRVRRPRDMPFAIHKALNEWFVDRFGVDYRGGSLFCTGDAAIAAGYKKESSTLISIEPLDDYSVCYSTKCKDLFGYYQFYWSAADTPIEKIRADMDSLGFVHQSNGGLQAAATSGHEVMLVAERFRYSLS
ncbi:hypothetical protein [Ralstonia pseudosolanacearum]|uniref:hypothetical protein n=1 Tax=Ralstonia pseudosolanacearum TaxID=1310165 RepID=UPI001FFBE559|nr:hypothetical protein [Ralstonia pseudosolanacearum]